MAYQLAPQEEVQNAMEAILMAHGVVSSQKAFLQLVKQHLQLDWAAYKLGSTRLRKLALRSGLAHLEVHTRANPHPRILHRCPVCSSRFEHVRNTTLYGGEVTLGHRCSLCHFSTGKDWREPARYVFHYKGPHRQPRPSQVDQSLLNRQEVNSP